jgi:hypothetical protein
MGFVTGVGFSLAKRPNKMERARQAANKHELSKLRSRLPPMAYQGNLLKLGGGEFSNFEEGGEI